MEIYFANPKDPRVIEKLPDALTLERFMLDKLENDLTWDEFQYNICLGYEVLGKMLMDGNIEIGDGLKERIIKWAYKDYGGSRSFERREVINNFINQIKKH